MSSRVVILFAVVGFVALTVAGAALEASGVKINLFSNEPSVQEVDSGEVTVPPVTAQDHARGAEDPVITWIEYSDLECPFCARFHPVMVQVMETYGDQVQWVYRHLPLEGAHPGAYSKAQASECVASLAGEEAFWVYIDAIFAVGPTFPVDDLAPLAGQLGISADAFQTCMDSGIVNAGIDEDFAGGLRSGVQGTPTSFIIDPNGVVSELPGVPDFAQMTLIIEALLAEQTHVQ